MRNKSIKLNYGFFSRIPVFISQGYSVEKIVLAVVLGVALGLIPLIGVSTILCFVAVFLFRLNPAIIQMANYVVFPFQIMLYYPFLRLGSVLFGGEIPATIAELVVAFKSDWWHTFFLFFKANLQGIAAWVLVLFPLGLLAYGVMVFIIRRTRLFVVFRKDQVVSSPGFPS